MNDPSPGVQRYADTWKRQEDLESLNARIHDGAPPELLLDRARTYRELLFEITWPEARPREGEWTLEFGSGVGWIMQAMLERYPIARAVGLDISENMIARATERLHDPRASFIHYDGLHIPLNDGEVPVIYSTAAIQHVEKHVAFILVKELFRILEPQGHAVLHFLSLDNLVQSGTSYEEECWNHVNGVETHWHHYYAFDELFVWFAELIGVDDLDIRDEPGGAFLVHFSKGTGRRFAREELPSLTYRGRIR